MGSRKEDKSRAIGQRSRVRGGERRGLEVQSREERKRGGVRLPDPTAMPMSAAFRAGASLTPSPVMPTTWPLCCKARTMYSLCLSCTIHIECRQHRNEKNRYQNHDQKGEE
jgi:hypothetical protein